MKKTGLPVKLQEITAWMSRISLSWRGVVASQAQFSSAVTAAAVSYNRTLAGLFRAGAVPALIVQSLEKTRIDNNYYFNRHPGATTAAKKKLYRRLGDLAPEEVESRGEGTSAANMKAQPTGGSDPYVKEYKQAITRPALPNIALMLQAVLAHRIATQKSGQDNATVDDDDNKNLDKRAPEEGQQVSLRQLAGGSEFFKTIEQLVNSAIALQSANGVRPQLLASLLKSIPSHDLGHGVASFRRGRLTRDSGIATQGQQSYATQSGSSEEKSGGRMAGELSAPPIPVEQEKNELARIGKQERKDRFSERARSDDDNENLQKDALHRVVSLQRMMANAVSAIIPAPTQPKDRRSARRGSSFRSQQPKNPAGPEIPRRFSPLERYLAGSADLNSAINIGTAERMTSTSSYSSGAKGMPRGKTQVRKPLKLVGEQTSISDVFSKVIAAMSGVTSQGSQSGLDLWTLPSVLHSVASGSAISLRSAVGSPGQEQRLSFESNDIRSAEADVDRIIGPERSIPRSAENASYAANDLSNLVVALSAASTVVKNVTDAVSQSIQSAYRLQSSPGGPSGQQVAMGVPSHKVMTAGRTNRGRRQGIVPELSGQAGAVSPLEQGSEMSNGSTRTLYSPKRAGASPTDSVAESERSGSYQLATSSSNSSSVASLQQTYSKYIFENMIRRTRGGGAYLLTVENQSQIAMPVHDSLRSRKSGAAGRTIVNEQRMRDGSLILPSVTQLSAVLATHSARKSGIANSSLALLSPDHIVSTPVPPATAVRKNHNNAVPSYPGSSSATGSSLMASSGRGFASGSTTISSASRRDAMDRRFEKRQGSNGAGSKEPSNKGLSLRELRKMMEQIFHDELKRYGL